MKQNLTPAPAGFHRKAAIISLIIIVLVVVIDQAMKIWVKTSFALGEDVKILPFFHLAFVENNGMAFGMEFTGKMLLSLFRIVILVGGSYYLVRLCRRGTYPLGFIACVALVTAGALGNIIDCVFYGKIFTESNSDLVAHLVPWGQGYAGLLHGKVVDMLYFPFFSFYWPEWLPFIGGHYFEFFGPVFNIADAAICVGTFCIIIFYGKLFDDEPVEQSNDKARQK